jgi:hypothetical protein
MHREENVGVANKPAEQGPRTWCETDVDPDSDAWWNTKQIFIESFTTTVEASERGTLRSQGRIEAPMASLEPDLKIEHKDEMHVDTDLFPLFPKQYTISEDELARVALDTLQVDGEDDFELAWDEESDSGDMDVDMDIEPAAVYSDASTPAPSTPVAAARIVSLPVSVPSTPARRGTLPTSTTPVRQNSFHATPSMGSIPIASPSSMTTRSVARVRGFAVHSPRTELVL